MKVLVPVLAALTVLAWSCPAYAPLRLARLRAGLRAPPTPESAPPEGRNAVAAADRHRREAKGRRWSRAAACLTGFGAGVFVGGAAGLAVGFAMTVVVDRVLVRLEPRAAVLRRERLIADLPLVADLLAACLRAGGSPITSIEALATALPGPMGVELAHVAATLRLGGGAVAAWSGFAGERALAPFGRAMVRVWDSGAPLAETLDRLADDARRTRRAAADERARAVGVKAAAPLALCFLPAFVLVGIVPLVAGAVAGLLR
jgi:Flp pilus assembly protein TadB